jgi:DNA repair exonuclease SbcCD ATPase subunit
MKIQYIRLDGIYGFKRGMNLDTVEIDFRNQQNKIILIIGGNRVGKSTLIQHLHPFANPTTAGEGRKTFLNPEYPLQHRKYMMVGNGDITYEIEHLYYLDSPTRSYIRRNGEELNPGGGSTTFENIVFAEMNLPKEYLKLGRIGSGMRGLLQMPASERKNFINRILPTVDQWLRYHKVVMENWRQLKSRTSVIGDLLSRLEKADVLQQRLQTNQELQNAYKNSRDENQRMLGALQAQIQQSSRIPDTDIDLNDVSTYRSYLTDYQKINQQLTTVREEITLLQNTTDVDFTVKQARYKYERSQKLTDEIHVDVRLVGANIARLQNELSSLKNDMTREISVIDVGSLQQEIDYTYNALKTAWDEYLHYYSMIPSNDGYKHLDGLTDEVSRMLRDIHMLILEYRSSDTGAIYETYPGTTDAEIGRQIAVAKHTLLSLQREIAKLEKTVVSGNLASLRPADCVIHTCPYFINAQSNDTNQKILGILRESYTQWENYYVMLESVRDNREQSRVLTERLIGVVKRYNPSIEILRALGLSFIPVVNRYEIYMYLQQLNLPELAERVDRCIVALRSKRIYTECYTRYENLKYNFKTLSQAAASQQRAAEIAANKTKKLQSELVDLQKQFDELITQAEASKNQTDHDKSVLETLQRIQELKTLQLQLSHDIKPLQKIASTINSFKDTYSELLDQKQSLVGSCRDLDAKIIECDKQYQAIVKALTDREQYETELQSIQSVYDNCERLKRTLDPVRGIPVYFANTHLRMVSVPVNQLITMSCHNTGQEEFSLIFEVTDTEFSIKLFAASDIGRDTTSLLDISECSGSEQAIGNLAMSFGLLSTLHTNFGVVCVDELDGVFDANYKRSFISALYHQATVLDCEQVFIISHNREFDNMNVDVILMQGHNADQNLRYNVLWEYIDAKT